MLSEDTDARAWNETVEALERSELVMPPARGRTLRPHPGRSILATGFSAIAVVVLSVLLGRL